MRRLALAGLVCAGLMLVGSQPSSALASLGAFAGNVKGPHYEGEGIEVHAYDSSNKAVSGALPGFNGNYSVANIPEGTYYACFTPFTSVYEHSPYFFVQQCYAGAPVNAGLTSASSIIVEGGKTTFGVNATLTQGGYFEGKITDATTGNGVKFEHVTVLGAAPRLCPEPTCAAETETGIGSLGLYTTPTVAPGSYTLKVSGNTAYKEKLVPVTATAATATTENVALEPVGTSGGGGGGSGGGGGNGATPPTTPPAVKCKKGFRKKTVHGKTKCVKRKKHHKH